MRRQILFVFAFALLSSGNSSAQQPALLPEHLGDAAASGHAFKPTTPGDPQVWAEVRVVASEARMYTNHTQVDLYQFHDPSEAYAIATYLQRVSLDSSRIEPSLRVMRTGGADDELFQVGNFVGRAYAAEKGLAMTMEKAVTAAIINRADKTPLPPIRTYLPREDLENASQRYALGPAAFRAAAEVLGQPEFGSLADAVGFPSGAEAMFGRYKAGALLILVDYPTPQLAELHLRHLETSLPDKAKQGGTTIERKGSLLSIVMASTPGYAAKLRDGVTYETQVTWNEPSGTATDAPWGVVLYRIFVGTGIFMVAAVVLGIGFGGIRIFTKRLFPGKVFDRPEQMEVLQLGLSGKRIDPRDFY